MSETHDFPGDLDGFRAFLLESSSARAYFLRKADEHWLGWILDNHILDAIRKKSPDPDEGWHRLPETGYLVRIAKAVPARVVDIMLDVPITEETLNRDVIEKFLWICDDIPADQLARVVPKISREGWFRLLDEARCEHFPGIARTLFDSGRHEELVTLAGAMLSLRSPDSRERPVFWRQIPFHVTGLTQSGLFGFLCEIEKPQVERAFCVAAGALAGIALTRCLKSRRGPFGLDDNMFLAGIDLLSIEPNPDGPASPATDTLNLAAAVRTLAKRLESSREGGQAPSSRVLSRHISELPDCQSMWRLSLLLLSLIPDAPKSEVRRAIFRPFSGEHGIEAACCSEYLATLRDGFPSLGDGDRKEFIRKLLDSATKCGDFAKVAASALASVGGLASRDDLQRAEGLGIAPAQRRFSGPNMEFSSDCIRLPARPVDPEEMRKFPVELIAEHLKRDWSPPALKRLEGEMPSAPGPRDVAEAIREDVAARPHEYSRHAGKFLDREAFVPHYTQAFIDSMRQLVQSSWGSSADIDIDRIIDCCHAAVVADKGPKPQGDPVDIRAGPSHLLGWNGIRFGIAHLVWDLLCIRAGPRLLDFPAHRSQLLRILSNLATSDAPVPRQVDPSSGGSPLMPLAVHPSAMMLNSVSGAAFAGLVLFAQRDSALSSGGGKGGVCEDFRTIVEDAVLKEDPDVLFLFGCHFRDFHDIDGDWALNLLSSALSACSGKPWLFLVAWLGYLQCVPKPEFAAMSELHALYRDGLAVTNEAHLAAGPLSSAEHRLSGHLANFFAYLPEFDAGHRMYDELVTEANPDLLTRFVRHISEGDFMDGADVSDSLARKLMAFWDRTALPATSPGVLAEFGRWISPRSKVFSPEQQARLVRKTLELTDGNVVCPDMLAEAVTDMAEHAPEDTLEIVRMRLGAMLARHEIHPADYSPGGAWHRAICALASDPRTAQKTRSLLEELTQQSDAFLYLMELLADQLVIAK